ncbi:hypothetical protein EV426DRAFT_665981 [Tirmania nivea]|nr:hypothetical protein EV426DRAFT_665981 [Tirmania nivea]
MASRDHPNYPPLLPRAVLQQPLRPFPHVLRQELTQQLQRRPCEITRAFLATVNLNLLFGSPAEEQRLVHTRLRGLSPRALTQLAQACTAALRQWRTTSGRPVARQEGVIITRSAHTRQLALERDSQMCVLTREPRPEVAHIIAYSLGRHAGALDQTMPNVMAFLEMFAGPGVVNNINNYLMRPTACGESQINRVENLLCLAPGIHHLFGSGIFVLEPVGDPLSTLRDNREVLTSYQVRFSWLTENRPSVENPERQDSWDLEQLLDPGIPMSEEDDPIISMTHIIRNILQHPHGPRLPRRLRIEPVETGFIFTLSTSDPVRHPLPHPDLLVLHAAVMRVVRAAGMSLVQEDPEWDSPEGSDVSDTVTSVDMNYSLDRFLRDNGEGPEPPV